jgi:two-component system, OmpR family, sensor histidine kinase BaeS
MMRCEPPRRRMRDLPGRRRHGRLVRRLVFIIVIFVVFGSAGSSMLVSMFTGGRHVPTPVAILGLVLAFMLVSSLARTVRDVGRGFDEQRQLRRQLMADVAHELRTPLSILQGRIEGLIDGVYPRDDAQLEQLHAETKHLSRLVEDVRTLANAEAGALDLQKESVDLSELVRDTALSVDSAIRVSVEPGLTIDADAVRIREVLLNLLTNAKQHAEGASVSVDAAAKGSRVIVRVADSGPGIPATELSTIFDRFQKGRHSKGSGLGLSIAKKLVLAHGGDIEVQSTPGSGTTVIVTLPR